MLRRLLHIGLGLVCLALIAVVMAAARSTTSALPLPPGRVFTAPAVALVKPDAPRAPVTPAITDKTVLAPLPADLGVGKIPAGMATPLKTNAWWSSGMLAPFPAPLFPLPTKAVFADNGLLLSTTGRRWQDKTIFATDTDPLRIFSATPATGAQAVTSGDWDVTFRVRGSAGPLFDATIIQGSPFTFIRPFGSKMSVALPPSAVTTNVDCYTSCGSALLIKAASATYLLVSPTKNAFTVTGGIVDIRFENGRAFLTVAAVAPGSEPAAYLVAAMRPYTGTVATYAVSNGEVSTTFRYPQATLMGLLPHHFASLAYAPMKNEPSPFQGGDPAKVIGTFETLRGPLRIYLGQAFRTSIPRPSILPALPPLPSLQKDAALKAQLRTDIQTDPPPAGDVYWQVKSIQRTAQLVELADALREGDLWKAALEKSKAQLVGACTASPSSTLSFAYDKTAGGIIAMPVGFGSEHYNDHHFHYGYLLHAASIVGRYDPAFLKHYGDCFRLLARDIASADRKDPSFPYLRYFDPYGGHSWASGITLFGDGTNQESVSEAMQAWHSLALFGRTTGAKNLENLGTWLYAQESFTDRVYWLNAVPGTGAFPEDFPFPMISLLWSGKADHATWFDGAEAPIRGIQFFPVSTALLPILDEEIVTRMISQTAEEAENTIWKSGLTMIRGIYEPGHIVPNEAPIDPAYSRTFVNYWQKAFAELGEPVAFTDNCLGAVFQKDPSTPNGKPKITAVIYRFATDPAVCTFRIGKRTINLTQLNVGWSLRGL